MTFSVLTICFLKSWTYPQNGLAIFCCYLHEWFKEKYCIFFSILVLIPKRLNIKVDLLIFRQYLFLGLVYPTMAKPLLLPGSFACLPFFKFFYNMTCSYSFYNNIFFLGLQRGQPLDASITKCCGIGQTWKVNLCQIAPLINKIKRVNNADIQRFGLSFVFIYFLMHTK